MAIPTALLALPGLTKGVVTGVVVILVVGVPVAAITFAFIMAALLCAIPGVDTREVRKDLRLLARDLLKFGGTLYSSPAPKSFKA
jgi:hypothetical protein